MATRREIGELSVLPEIVASYREDLAGKATSGDLDSLRDMLVARLSRAEARLSALQATSDRLQIDHAESRGRSEGRTWALRILAALTIGLASWAAPVLTKGLIPPAIKIAVALQEVTE